MESKTGVDRVTLTTFLDQVEGIKTEAETEINSKDDRMMVTAIHGKYLGPRGVLQNALRGFNPANETDSDLSKHAVREAETGIKKACLTRIKHITRLEQSK